MIAMIIIADEGTRLITAGLLRDKMAFVKLREKQPHRSPSYLSCCLTFTVIISLNNSVGLVISYEDDEQCSERIAEFSQARGHFIQLTLLKMTFQQKIRAAEGYAELGMYDDALAELDQIAPDQQDGLETLRMRVEIVLRMRDWKSALRSSLKVCQLYPDDSSGFIHAAFCLHELGRTKEAKQTLLEGPAKLLDEPVYYYNLGCYDAVLGNLDQAKAYLRASFRLDKSFRDMAKSDPDLRQIRDEL